MWKPRFQVKGLCGPSKAGLHDVAGFLAESGARLGPAAFFNLKFMFCICDRSREFDWDRDLVSGFVDSFRSTTGLEKGAKCQNHKVISV